MQMNHVDHFYRGKLIRNGATASEFDIIATTPQLSDAAQTIFSRIKFGTHNTPTSLTQLQHGFGLMKYNERFSVFSHVYPSTVLDRNHVYPEYHCSLIPMSYLNESEFNLFLLKNDLESGVEGTHFPDFENNLAQRELSLPSPLPTEHLKRCLDTLRSHFSSQAVAQLVDAILTEKTVAITGLTVGWNDRLEIAQALLLLFPNCVRSQISVSSEVFDSGSCEATIKLLFDDPRVKPSNSDEVIAVGKAGVVANKTLVHAYAQLISQIFIDKNKVIEVTSEMNRLILDRNYSFTDQQWIQVLEGFGLVYLFTNGTLMQFFNELSATFSFLYTLENAIRRYSLPSRIDWDLFAHVMKASSEFPSNDVAILSKKLATLLGELGDDRTKTNLVRRNRENLDIQIQNGQLDIQNAIDLFKRISGTLQSTRHTR